MPPAGQLSPNILRHKVIHMMYLARKYEANQTREHWRALAVAYLDASERLCQDMVNGSWPPSYDHGQPAL